MVRKARDRLAGTIEVDEIFIGGERSATRGRGAAGKSLVLVVAQEADKGIRRIGLLCVAAANGERLEAAVAQTVDFGSTVRTDAWRVTFLCPNIVRIGPGVRLHLHFKHY